MNDSCLPVSSGCFPTGETSNETGASGKSGWGEGVEQGPAPQKGDEIGVHHTTLRTLTKENH